MGSLSQITVFGKTKYKANTFIGGVANLIPDTSSSSTFLKVSSNRVKAFKTIGNDIEFAIIDGNYEIHYNRTIFKNSALTYYKDPEGLLTYIYQDHFLSNTQATEFYFPKLTGCNHNLFSRNSKLTKCHVPKLTTASHSLLAYCPLVNDINLEYLTTSHGGELAANRSLIHANLPNLTIGPHSLVGSCSSLKTFSAPKLTNLTGTKNFADLPLVELINIPSYIQLGASPSVNSNQFQNIKIGCTINIHASMATINSGIPDADLVYAGNVRGAIINYA